MKFASLSALSLALAFTATAFAADAPTTTGKPAPTSAEITAKQAAAFKRLDTNNDGYISKDEFTARALKRFDEIDTNHDGKISPAEMNAYYDKKRASRMKHNAERRANAAKLLATPATAPTK